MAGDLETGIMIMKMDEGLDTGPVAMAEKVEVAADMTAGELRDEDWVLAGADLMVRAMAAPGARQPDPDAATRRRCYLRVENHQGRDPG